MRKVITKIICALVMVSMCIATVGCGSKGAATRSAMKFDSKYKGKTLTIWQWWDEDDATKKVADEFEKASGVKVKYENIPFNSYMQKVVTAVSAGTGPDIVWLDASIRPSWMVKNIVMPLDKYIDLKKPAFADNYSKSVKDFFTINGKIYGYGNRGLNTDLLYYNKSMFENNGLEDPFKQYKAGKWTWDEFIKDAQALTQDTNSDGKIDVYGYDAWPTMQWVFSNGGEVVNVGKSGAKFALDDQKAIKGLDTLKDLDSKYHVKSPYNPNKDPQQKFLSGETAMDYWGSWDIANDKQKMGDKLGIVPFPAGPDVKPGTTKDIVGNSAMAFAKTCKDPTLAALYLEFQNTPESKEAQSKDKAKQKADDLKNYGSQDVIDVVSKMSETGKYDPTSGFGDKFKSIMDKITGSGNSSTQQSINEYKQQLQSIIDDVMSGK